MPRLTCTLNAVQVHRAETDKPTLVAMATFSDGHTCRVRYRPGTIDIMRRAGEWGDGDTKWETNPRASEVRRLAVHDAAAPIFAAEVAKQREADEAHANESARRDAEANEYHLKCAAGAVLYDALMEALSYVTDSTTAKRCADALNAAEGQGRREYHVGTPDAPYLQDVWATSPEEAARRYAYGNRGKHGMTMRPCEVEVFTERQPYRHFRFKSDADLARELDRLENHATSFGTERDAQLAAIRAIIAERTAGK
jgi:hypothetical protein